jgi:hypothetical protein
LYSGGTPSKHRNTMFASPHNTSCMTMWTNTHADLHRAHARHASGLNARAYNTRAMHTDDAHPATASHCGLLSRAATRGISPRRAAA